MNTLPREAGPSSGDASMPRRHAAPGPQPSPPQGASVNSDKKDLLYILLTGSIIAAVALIVFHLVMGFAGYPRDTVPLDLVVGLFSILSDVFFIVFLRLGKVRFVREWIVPVALVVVVCSAFTESEPLAPSFMFFFPIAYLAAFILERRLLVLTICVMAVAAIVFVATHSIRVPGGDTRFQIYYWLDILASFGLTGALHLKHFKNMHTLMKYSQEQTDERMKTEALLKKSETLYRTLFAAAPDGIIVLREGQIIDCNDMALILFGASQKDLIGKTIEEISAPYQVGGELTRVLAGTLRERIPREGPIKTEWIHRRTDGSDFMVEICLVGVEIDGGQTTIAMYRDITERKLQEARLAESESRFRMLISESPIAISLQRENIIIYHNPAYAILVGYERDACLTGMDVTQFVAEEFRGNLKKREEIRLSGRQEESSYVGQGIKRDGTRVPIAVHAVPVTLQDGSASLIFVNDLSDYEQAVTALKESQAGFQAITDSTDDLIWSVDAAEFRIVSFNKAFSDFVYAGYGVRLVPGLRLNDYLPKELAAFWTSRYKRVLSDGPLQEIYTSWYGARKLDLMLGQIKSDNTVHGISVFAKDITRQAAAEDHERIMRERIFQAEKLSSLGLLVAGIAHEINNPNQYIKSNLDILASAWKDAVPILDEYEKENGDFLLGGIQFSELREKQAELFAAVEDGTRRIHTIISELTSFAGNEQGTETQNIDVNKAVSSAIELSRGVLKSKAGTFLVRPGKNLPPVRARAQRVEQVVLNLINNACQAMDDPDKGIEVETGLNSDGDVYISVKDEGRGMSEEELSRLLTPFYTTRRASGGTGLGLYVSMNIIKSYGGDIHFDSKPGLGTTATVTFPTGAMIMEGAS